MNQCSLSLRDGALAVVSPKHWPFINAIKALPSQARRWNGSAWLVDPAYGKQVQQLIKTCFGEDIALPQTPVVVIGPQLRAVRLEYLGQCKEREFNGPITALGFADGDWSLIFPEAVLKAWFQGASATDEAKPAGTPETFYAVLGASQKATDAELKASYRRLVRQWHPDVCKEADAAEQFKRIQHAWDTLGDTKQRKKYDAGLYFAQHDETAITQRSRSIFTVRPQPFRAPLRCGLLLVEVTPSVGRWMVSKILSWDDVTDDLGRVLVTSWNTDANGGRGCIEKVWVTQ